MTARYAAKRILQAVFVVVMIAALGSLVTAQPAVVAGLVMFVVGLAGFIAASYIPAKN